MCFRVCSKKDKSLIPPYMTCRCRWKDSYIHTRKVEPFCTTLSLSLSHFKFTPYFQSNYPLHRWAGNPYKTQRLTFHIAEKTHTQMHTQMNHLRKLKLITVKFILFQQIFNPRLCDNPLRSKILLNQPVKVCSSLIMPSFKCVYVGFWFFFFLLSTPQRIMMRLKM